MGEGFNPDFVKCPYCGKPLEGAESKIDFSGKLEKLKEGHSISFVCKKCNTSIITTVFRTER